MGDFFCYKIAYLVNNLLMIYIVWGVFFCFCLLYVLTVYVNTPRFVQPVNETEILSDIDVSYLERLLQNGEISSFATHKDVMLLKKHGLFQTLPMVKLYSPTEQEFEECVRLQKKYQFTTYVIDANIDTSKFEKGFVYLNTSETSLDILFALNRLKLVEQEQIKSLPLSKSNYTKTVCGGVKYEFNPLGTSDAKLYSFVEYLPSNGEIYFVTRSSGYKTEFENLFSGEKFYVFSNKKILVKYEKIMQKLIFYITKNQLNNNLIIYSTKKNINKIEIKNNNSKISWSTTDERLNKRLQVAFENCEQNYYKKYNFVLCQNSQKEYSSLQDFIFCLKSGEIDLSTAQNIFVENFLGVKINGDRVNFSKPKLDEDYVLSVDFENKRYLITRKKSDSNICQISIDGVCYRNFTSFCFHGITTPEIFVEY